MITNYIKSKLSTSTAKLFFLTVLLSVLSFNHAFNFHLFTDDWYQILGFLYFPDILTIYLQIHPANFLEFKLFSPLFQFNPFPWQFLGFLLKVIGALSMWPLFIALTDSKKAALYSCLIYAVFVVGIESVIWPSAHSSPIIVPLINLGFYLWIQSGKAQSKSKYLYSLILFCLSILAEPGRAFIVGLLVPFWELLSLYQRFSFKNALVSIIRLFLFFVFIALSAVLVQVLFQTASHSGTLLPALLSIRLDNIITSLMNPLFGWTLLSRQVIYWAAVIFLVINIVLFILFLWKKQNIYKIIVFLSVWVLLFYLPSMTQYFAKSGLPMESRYHVLSAVGVVGLIAYGFSFIKSKYINWLMLLFLIFNLYVTNNLLLKYSVSRSIQAHDKVWNKIEHDVPKGEIGSVFMYSGENYLHREYLLDYKDTMPFAVRRGITKKEEFPIMTNDKNLIARLVCEKNVSRHSLSGDLIQKEPIPLSHVHAWELKKGGELENRSEQERDGIKKLAKCLQADSK